MLFKLGKKVKLLDSTRVKVAKAFVGRKILIMHGGKTSNDLLLGQWKGALTRQGVTNVCSRKGLVVSVSIITVGCKKRLSKVVSSGTNF